jgi:hypothetical protein
VEKIVPLSSLRVTALVILLLSCGGSVWLMFRVASRDESVFIGWLLVAWVLSPFLALAITSAVSGPWSVTTRLTLYSVMVFIGLCSLIGYSGALSPPGAKPLAAFHVVPLVSWLLMAIVIPLAAILSNKHEI